jgi:hypothetical protein
MSTPFLFWFAFILLAVYFITFYFIVFHAIRDANKDITRQLVLQSKLLAQLVSEKNELKIKEKDGLI